MNDLIAKQNIQDFKIDWNYYLKTFLITQSGLSQRTIRGYKTAITKFIVYLQDNEINAPMPDDIHEYQGYLKEKHFSIFTINLYMIVLKKFFAYLQQPYKDQKMKVYKDIFKMAAPEIKKPARGCHYRENPTREAVKALRGTLINLTRQIDQRDLLMIDLGLYCGCRVNEIANIKTTDIVKDGETYKLYLLRKRQTAKIAFVYIDPGLVSRIRGYTYEHGIKNYIFQDLSHVQAGKKAHLCSSTISSIITKHLKKAEIKKDRITAHSLRHHAGTMYYQKTKDIYATQQFMGHSDSKTTEIYMHVDKNYEAAEVALEVAPEVEI